MIDRTEAQTIHDDLIRALHQKLKQPACQVCGSSGVTAAEMNVLRQMLKDNEFQGIMSGGGGGQVRSISSVPFPQPSAAHAPDKAQAQG